MAVGKPALVRAENNQMPVRERANSAVAVAAVEPRDRCSQVVEHSE